LLYNADCCDALPRPAKAGIEVPLTITSPPYNIGKEYEKVRSLDEYIDWCTSWMAGVHAVTSSDGAFWLNVGYVPHPNGKAVPIAYLLWDKSDFFLRQEIVWHY